MNLDDLLGSTDSVLATAPEVPEVLTTKIPCPGVGIFHNIPASLYHSWDCMSSTFVKAYSVNPYAAKYKPFTGSPAADLGSGCHSFCLEGRDAFNKEFFVMEDIPCPAGQNPKGWKNTNLYKEKAAAILSEVDGRTILTHEQYTDILGIDKSLREHPISSKILNRGFNELSLVFLHEESGLLVKARLDDYFEGIPSDLKTCNDVAWFHRDLYKRRYNLQGGLYSMACEANGLPVNYFCFLAAQTTETYPVRCGYIEPERLEQAKAEVTRMLGLIKESQERDYWPNFAPPPLIHSWDQMTPSDLLEEF